MTKKNQVLCFLLLISLSLFSQGNDQTRAISITYPANEQPVTYKGESIKFSSVAAIDKDYVPVVFIQDPTKQWWPWLTSNSNNSTRTSWELTPVQFGVPSDFNKTFGIVIVAIPLKDIDNGILAGDNNTIFIEGGTAIKNSIFSRIILKQYPTQSRKIVVIRQ